MKKNPKLHNIKKKGEYKSVKVKVPALYKEYRIRVRAPYDYRRGSKRIHVKGRYERAYELIRPAYSYVDWRRIKPAKKKPVEKTAFVKAVEPKKVVTLAHTWVMAEEYLIGIEKNIRREYPGIPIVRRLSPYMRKKIPAGIKVMEARYLYVEPKMKFNWSDIPRTPEEENILFNVKRYNLIYLTYYVKLYTNDSRTKYVIAFRFTTKGFSRLYSILEMQKKRMNTTRLLWIIY